MNDNAQENNLKLSIEYVSENSNNSADDDDNFQTYAKLIYFFKPNGFECRKNSK